jgi:hypothetical protein
VRRVRCFPVRTRRWGCPRRGPGTGRRSPR